MNIKDVSERTGIPPKTIRYYEDIGLVTPARSENGYRDFSTSDAHKLGFLGRGRALGFSIEECRALLALWEDDQRTSAEVKAIAERHLDDIENKIRDLREMRDTLKNLVRSCSGDARPDCPILGTLAND